MTRASHENGADFDTSDKSLERRIGGFQDRFSWLELP